MANLVPNWLPSLWSAFGLIRMILVHGYYQWRLVILARNCCLSIKFTQRGRRNRTAVCPLCLFCSCVFQRNQRYFVLCVCVCVLCLCLSLIYSVSMCICLALCLICSLLFWYLYTLPYCSFFARPVKLIITIVVSNSQMQYFSKTDLFSYLQILKRQRWYAFWVIWPKISRNSKHCFWQVNISILMRKCSGVTLF